MNKKKYKRLSKRILSKILFRKKASYKRIIDKCCRHKMLLQNALKQKIK